MKFGIVLPTHAYNQQRVMWATAAFMSLAKTVQPSEKPLLMVVEHKDSLLRQASHTLYIPQAFKNVVVDQPDEIGGTEQTLAWGTEHALMLCDISHVVWMGDDALFSPDWLNQLEGLVRRHPDAKAWSVYRSAHVRYHAPLKEEAEDVLVRSLCGHGMTFAREEWMGWGIDWRGPVGMRWPSVSGGNTLDLHHACNREGERWCTAKSYVQHTGVRGVNVTEGVPEYALNFVGE